MEPDKNQTPAEGTAPDKAASETTQAPADALSRTPDDLAADPQAQAAAAANKPVEDPSAKKISPLKKLFRKVNLYFLVFMMLVVVSAAIAIVNYFNSQKTPPAASIASTNLSTDALKQLANTDTSVGSASQTLTIQGNTIISGQTLTRGNLNVAGNFQTGGSVTIPSLTVAGTSNLGTAQINTLQVAGTTAIQGTTTVRDLNVAGGTTISGPLTASQITTSKLVLSGNASLQVPNHISFPGASPGRSINQGVLGNGGSASINGSDTSGTINVNSGNNPTAGCFITVNFQQKYASNPHVMITPVGAGAGQINYYVTRDTNGFSVCGDNPAPSNQVFAFDYFVTD